MAIHSAGFVHRLDVLMAVLTHSVVGYTLVSLWRGSEPVAGLVGGILPDIDLLFPPAWQFPFVHRGLTHTPVACGLVAGAVFAATGRRTVSIGIATGYLAHLVIDTLTESGVMWLYPLSTMSYAFEFEAHAAVYEVVVWSVALAVMVFLHRFRSD